MSVVALQLAAAGTSIGAGVLTLVVPAGLVIVVLSVWWVALRRSRTRTSAAMSATPTGRPATPGEEPPPALHGS
jgi:hypothetical protein